MSEQQRKLDATDRIIVDAWRERGSSHLRQACIRSLMDDEDTAIFPGIAYASRGHAWELQKSLSLSFGQFNPTVVQALERVIEEIHDAARVAELAVFGVVMDPYWTTSLDFYDWLMGNPMRPGVGSWKSERADGNMEALRAIAVRLERLRPVGHDLIKRAVEAGPNWVPLPEEEIERMLRDAEGRRDESA